MTTSSHHHQDQGARIQMGASQKRHEVSKLEHCLSHGHVLSTLSEYKHKLRKRYQKDDDGEEGDDDGDLYDNLAPEGPEVIRDSEDDGVKSEPDEPMQGALRSGSSQSHGDGLAKQNAALLMRAGSSQDVGSSSKKRRRADSMSTLHSSPPAQEAAAAEGTVKEEASDTASMAPTDLVSIADGKLSDEDKVRKYVIKLGLEKALQGRKMGVSKNFASDCIKRGMGATHAAQLRGHIKLVEWASSLAGPDLDALDADEVREAVVNLQDRVEAWPPSVLINLWKRHVKQYIVVATAEARSESTQERMSCYMIGTLTLKSRHCAILLASFCA